MAASKPQKEHGYIQLACELHVALLIVRLGHGTKLVVGAVLDQVFGPGKPKSAVLDRRRLMGSGAFPEDAHLRRAVKEAVDNGLLRKNADGTYRFSTRYPTWGPDDPEEPRLLTPEQVEFCRSFRRYSDDSDQQKSRTTSDTEGPSGPAGNPSTQQQQSRTTGDTDGVSPLVHIGVDAVPPAVRSVSPVIRPSHISDLKTDGGCAAGAEAAAPSRESREREERRTVEAARAAFGDEFASAVAAMALDISYSLGARWDCYRAAIDRTRRAVDGGKGIGDLHAYCMKLAREYVKTGIPAPPVSAEGRARPKAPPPPEGYYRAPPDDPRKPVIIPVNSRLNRRA